MNADPKGKQHRLARKKTAQKIGMDQCDDWTEGRQEMWRF